MSARQIRVGDIVRSKITGRTGPVLRVEQYDDGTPRITAELTKGYDVGQPVYHFKLVRSADDGRVHDVVEAERQAYAVGAAWPRYESIRDDIARQNAARLASGPSIIRRVLDEVAKREPEGEPADIGEDDTPRPFQVGDEVLVDGEPGVIAEMRGNLARVDSTYALVEMAGLPFPAWDAVALSADRTRPVDSRQIELVRPASTGRISSQAGLASIRHGVVQPDDTAAAVVTAALAWEESYDQPSGTHSAIRTGQLMGAVRAHRAALGGAS